MITGVFYLPLTIFTIISIAVAIIGTTSTPFFFGFEKKKNELFRREIFFVFFKNNIIIIHFTSNDETHILFSRDLGRASEDTSRLERRKRIHYDYYLKKILYNTNTNIILPQTIDMKNQRPLMKQTTIKYYYCYYYYYYYLF